MRSGRIGTPWGERDDETLKQLVLAGATPIRAAAFLKRSIISVKSKARRLKTPFPTEQAARRRRNEKFQAAKRAEP